MAGEREDGTLRASVTQEYLKTIVGVWRAVVLAGVCAIGSILYTNVKDVQTLLVQTGLANAAIGEIKARAERTGTDLGELKLNVTRTETTVASVVQQILLDQNRRIAAIEDRSTKVAELLNDTQRELSAVRAELTAVRRSLEQRR